MDRSGMDILDISDVKGRERNEMKAMCDQVRLNQIRICHARKVKMCIGKR